MSNIVLNLCRNLIKFNLYCCKIHDVDYRSFPDLILFESTIKEQAMIHSQNSLKTRYNFWISYFISVFYQFFPFLAGQ